MTPPVTDSLVHAAVVIVVVIAATILAFGGPLTGHDASFVYATAVGYAAGRSGTKGGTP